MDLVAVLPGCVENGMSSPFGASYLDLLAFLNPATMFGESDVFYFIFEKF